MNSGYFITGTDTNIGKTLVSAAMVHALALRGKKVLGMKPVATGCIRTDQGLRNEDAEMLMQYSNVSLPYDVINPYAYELPVSPNLAVKHSKSEAITMDKILAAYDQACAVADWVIVEAVGGWMVPFNDTQTVEDMAKAIGLPVILVVGTRLGCINHAMLTMNRINESGVEVAGWVANIMERNVDLLPEVIDSLRVRLGVPLLGIIPPYRHLNLDHVINHLSHERLFE